MPSMTADYQTYDTDRLAQLMGSVTRLNLATESCMMRDNGENLMVRHDYCAHCNAIHGFDNDGEDDCIHKRALRLSWMAEVEAREEDRADLQATYEAALT